MQNSDIQKIEQEITIHEQAKKLAEALKRLRANPDFKLIIEEGYCKEYLDSKVLALAIVSTEANVNQTNRQIAGVGSFKQFLNVIEQNGVDAQRQIDVLNETRVAIINGEYNAE